MTATPTTPELRILQIDELHESPHNLRRHWDPKGLQELADNIALVGMFNPVLVRPQKTGGYEIGAGHRRYRAAKLANLSAVPALIREMSDQAFLELITIDNLQREDIHPLEEAEGYRALMKQGKYDVAALAARVGRSINYVYDRVKLLELTKAAQDLFWDGKITAGHAILLARLSPADQTRVIGSEDHEYRDGGLLMSELTLFTPEQEADDKINPSPVKAVSVRELAAYIDKHVKFDRTAVDPMLFQETADELAKAKSDAIKIIQITHEYSVHPDAKAGTERVFGPMSWTRADGRHGSKPCELAVVGVIVAGAGRGESFKVCTDKHKCTVHYAKEIKEREKRQKGVTAGAGHSSTKAADSFTRQQAKEREDLARREAEQARWKKALPAILTALAASVKKQVVISAEEEVIHERMVSALDAARQAGAKELSIVKRRSR